MSEIYFASGFRILLEQSLDRLQSSQVNEKQTIQEYNRRMTAVMILQSTSVI